MNSAFRLFFLCIIHYMDSYFKSVAVQVTSIFIAALGAATIAFIHSVAVSSGGCDMPQIEVQNASILGAVFKSIHSAMTFSRYS